MQPSRLEKNKNISAVYRSCMRTCVRYSGSESASESSAFPTGPPCAGVSRGYTAPMPEQSHDQLSRLQEYQQRLEKLMEAAREGFERQTPKVLDKLAATARNMAQRLDDMAGEARRTRAEKQARPESAGTSAPAPEPTDEPPSSAGESRTAGA